MAKAKTATKSRAAPTKPAAREKAPARTVIDPAASGWASDLVFNAREPKLAVSLRLDADVLRFFRGFGAGYQTRINEVLKAFMTARGGVAVSPAAAAKANAKTAANGKRTSR